MKKRHGINRAIEVIPASQLSGMSTGALLAPHPYTRSSLRRQGSSLSEMVRKSNFQLMVIGRVETQSSFTQPPGLDSRLRGKERGVLGLASGIFSIMVPPSKNNTAKTERSRSSRPRRFRACKRGRCSRHPHTRSSLRRQGSS